MIFATPAPSSAELELIETLDKLRAGLRYALQEPKKWTGLLRRNLAARAIQGSNTIEGYAVSFDDAVAVVEGEQIEAPDATRRAVEGYRMALTYILRLSDDEHLTINLELVRSLHYMMIAHDAEKHPGRWRPGPIYVRKMPGGEVVYEGPDAAQVNDLMVELVSSLQESNSTPTFIQAAMAHLNLVMIHPFSDGNGRMGRALQTLVLSRDRILAPTFASIEEYLGSRGNTDAYYNILAEVGAGKWHPHRDARPWIHFCLRAHLQQAVTVQRRVRETQRLWDELEAVLDRAGLNPRMIVALYEAAVGLRVRAARYRVLADVSAQVASRDLRQLVDNRLLAPRGEKKGRTYSAAPTLVAIRDRTREAKSTAADLFGTQLRLPL